MLVPQAAAARNIGKTRKEMHPVALRGAPTAQLKWGIVVLILNKSDEMLRLPH